MNDTIKNNLLYEKLNFYLQNESSTNNAFNELKRIDEKLLPEIERKNFFWNASIICYTNKDIYSSLYYINKYEKINLIDTTTEFHLLKLLIYSAYDTKIAFELIEKIKKEKLIDFGCLKCLSELESYQLKNKKIIQKLSIYLPGSGLIVNGNVLKGLISMGINTGTVLTIRYFWINQSYINMIAWGTNLITKFYLGNVSLTTKMVLKKESLKKQKLAKECEFLLKDILTNYPLNFKY